MGVLLDNQECSRARHADPSLKFVDRKTTKMYEAECLKCECSFAIPQTTQAIEVDCPECGGKECAENPYFIDAYELVGLLREYFNQISDGPKRFDVLVKMIEQRHVFYDFRKRTEAIKKLRIGHDLPAEHKTNPAINIQHMIDGATEIEFKNIVAIGRELEKEFSQYTESVDRGFKS